MDPHLRGLAILYAASVLWSGGFASWGFLAGVALRVPVVAALFAGPRLLSFKRGGSRFDLRTIPFPSSSVNSAYTEIANEVAAREERLGEPAPAALMAPFGGAGIGRRAIVLLGPYVLLVLLVGDLARVPGTSLDLLRGALSPQGSGADLARGFLRGLGEAPLGEALGRALRMQLAFVLLPIWAGLWSTLLFVARPAPARGLAWERVALAGTLLGLAILGAWAVAIVRVLAT